MRQNLFVAAVAAAVASPALAQMTLLSDSRSITASASATNQLGTTNVGPNSSSPSGFGAYFSDNVSAVASIVGVGAPCGAGQLSEILPGSMTLQGSVSGIVDVNETNNGIAGSIFSSSQILLSFSVPAGTQMSMQGSSSGLAGFTISGPNGVLIQNLGVLNFTTAQPTTYTVSALAQVAIDAPPNGSGSGGFSILITAVPAPGAAGLLALGGLFAARRNRR